MSIRRSPTNSIVALATVALASACSSNGTADASQDTAPDLATPDRGATFPDTLPDLVAPDVDLGDTVWPDAAGPAFCSIGGAVAGVVVPTGYCLRQFVAPMDLREPRVMSFAPNGDLFIAAPSTGAPGGAGGGPAAIVVVTDADRNGIGELHTFAGSLPDVHGLVVASDAVYFTTTAGVFRTPYANGQLAEVATMRTMVASFASAGTLRWTHGLSRSPSGRLYVTSGGFGSFCPQPDNGSVSEVTSGGTLSLLAHGFRNPMYTRCHYASEACAVSELGDDGGGSWGAREKILFVRASTDYGYPCCAANGVPASGQTVASCASVTMEEASMTINDTPFGLDWERGIWVTPWRNAMFVAKHGSFYSQPAWQGAGIWVAPTDPVTHAPTAPFQLFLGSFGPGGSQLERPADVTFAPDGRLFFVDDNGGGVYWMAPTELRMP